ncbi:flagellar basal body rod protein FlgB [Radicibacter daui]|uniref:flagellar basal body rod protein FlgB n=1 Tax=Radicibacter daui TaxID=3064829 RepID=UPI004046D2E5
MDLNNLTVFQLMKRKMDWMSENQKVIAQNISNADTPGYGARELEAFDFKKAMRSYNRLEPVMTSSAHQHGMPSAPQIGTIKETDPYETSPSGNSVILEQQVIAMQQNAADYQMALNLYQKQTSMLKTALVGR